MDNEGMFRSIARSTKRKPGRRSEAEKQPEFKNKMYFDLKNFESASGIYVTKEEMNDSAKKVKKVVEEALAKRNDRLGSLEEIVGKRANYKPFFVRQPNIPIMPMVFSKKDALDDSEQLVETVRTPFYECLYKNVLAEDVIQFTHLPLVAEDMDEDEVSKDFYKVFTNGIHGYVKNKYEITTELLYKIIKKLMQETESEREMELLYYSLYTIFPNYGSQKEFSEMVQKLHARFSVAKDVKTTEEMLAAIPEPSSRKNYIIKRISIENWRDLPSCSDNCQKYSKEAIDFMRRVLEDPNEGILYIGKVQRNYAPFLNALLNNGEVEITDFCDTAKNFEQHTCGEWFKILLERATPPHELDKFKLHTYQQRDQRFRKVVTSTVDKLSLDNQALNWSDTVSPCSHLGPCGPKVEECGCNGFCTIYCECDENCDRKFPGCRCAKSQCRTASCACVKLNFECHKWTCGPCLKDEYPCTNRPLTRGTSKRVRVGPTKIAAIIEKGIAANGLFIEEPAEKGECIGEYTGEVLSEEETERRGLIDKLSVSYVFALGERNGVIDAKRAGNLLRYANHSKDTYNCMAKLANVNGEARVGIFASRKLEAEEELLYDYNYDADSEKMFFKVRPEDRVPKVKSVVSIVANKWKKAKTEREEPEEVPYSPPTQTRCGRSVRRPSLDYSYTPRYRPSTSASTSQPSCSEE